MSTQGVDARLPGLSFRLAGPCSKRWPRTSMKESRYWCDVSRGQTICICGSLEAEVVEKGRVLHISKQSETHRNVFLHAACAVNTLHACRDTPSSSLQPAPSPRLDRGGRCTQRPWCSSTAKQIGFQESLERGLEGDRRWALLLHSLAGSTRQV